MQTLKNAMNEFENFLQNHSSEIMKSFHPHFEEAFFEMVKNGGKRLRPYLMLSIVEAINKEKIENSFDIALAIEVLHTYSLIHDDLPSMDNASLRRGKTTLHVKYDEVSALLAGDALNTYAFHLISNSKLKDEIKIKIIQALSFGALKMVVGQACDCYFENQKLNKFDLQFLHRCKTAELIASSIKIGAFIVNLDEKSIENLYEIGILFGILFQIRDDIIDQTLDSNIAGKTTNNDANKNSYVNLMGIENAIKEKNNLKNIILEKLDSIPNAIGLNLKIVIENICV